MSADVSTRDGKRLEGVGGWLGFFAFALLVLGPLVALFQWYIAFDELKPVLEKLPALKPSIRAGAFGDAVVAVYGMWVGWQIFAGNPNGKVLAKCFLLFSIVGEVLTVGLMAFLAHGVSAVIASAMFKESVKTVGRAVVVNGLWWAYFERSRRVQNTYG